MESESFQAHHVALENVIHDFVSGKSGGVYQELEGEFQSGVHLAPTSLSLAFLAAPLKTKSNEVK